MKFNLAHGLYGFVVLKTFFCLDKRPITMKEITKYHAESDLTYSVQHRTMLPRLLPVNKAAGDDIKKLIHKEITKRVQSFTNCVGFA